MNVEERLNLYEKMYLHEIDRREKINARLAVPLAICLALLGLIAWLLQNLPTPEHTYILWGSWFFLCFALTTVAIAVFFFMKTWSGYTDLMIASPEELEQYYQQLQQYDATSVDEQFQLYLLDCYKNYTSHNIKNNDKRSLGVNRTSVFLMLAICLAFLTYLTSLYGPEKDKNPVTPIKVECMTKSSSLTEPTENNPPQQGSQPKPASPPPIAPGPRKVKGDVPLPSAPNDTPPKGSASDNASKDSN